MNQPAAPLRVDCHVHIIDPQRFPYVDGRQPPSGETGDRATLTRLLSGNAMTHALLVQPSFYGTDNGAMLDALALGGGRFKGIAVVAPETSETDLAALEAKGVVGVRFNLVQGQPDALLRPGAERFLARLASRGWFVEVMADTDTWAKIAGVLAASGVRLLIDHMGAPELARGLDQPGFRAVLDLGRETDAVVKLSTTRRLTGHPFPFDDIEMFAAALVTTFGVDRCVWGSNWPLIERNPGGGYAGLLALLEGWLPEADYRNRVLGAVPARLFGFADVE